MSMKDFNEVKKAIINFMDYDDLKIMILNKSTDSLRYTDESGLNLIHLAILVKHCDCIRILFAKGIFQAFEQPNKFPYLHLAAVVGSPSIVNILLQERPLDINIKYEYTRDLIKFYKDYCADLNVHNQQSLNAQQKDCFQALTAIDLAAIGQNIKCLDMMLNFKSNELKLNFLETCVAIGSVSAVNVLLHTWQYNKSDFSKAFKRALLYKQAEFVDIFLKKSKEKNWRQCLEIVLNGMNPYHIMYLYSSAFSVAAPNNRFEGLKETTEVLVKHGFLANSQSPVGTYPLYSLICSMMLESANSPMEIPYYHLHTFQYLLEVVGVECNYFELEQKASGDDILQDLKIASAGGRALYQSAVHAFIYEMKNHHLVMFQIDFIHQCFELVLQNGGEIDQRLFVDLVDALAYQHSEGNVVYMWNIIALFLINGMNPNITTQCQCSATAAHKSTHLPTIYFNQLFSPENNNLTHVRFHFFKANNLLNEAIKLLYFMEHLDVLETSQEILAMIRSLIEETSLDNSDVLHNYLQFIDQEIQLILCQPQTLLFLCQKQIWIAVGRKKLNLDKMNLPKNLVIKIMNVFLS